MAKKKKSSGPLIFDLPASSASSTTTTMTTTGVGVKKRVSKKKRQQQQQQQQQQDDHYANAMDVHDSHLNGEYGEVVNNVNNGHDNGGGYHDHNVVNGGGYHDLEDGGEEEEEDDSEEEEEEDSDDDYYDDYDDDDDFDYYDQEDLDAFCRQNGFHAKPEKKKSSNKNKKKKNKSKSNSNNTRSSSIHKKNDDDAEQQMEMDEEDLKFKRLMERRKRRRMRLKYLPSRKMWCYMCGCMVMGVLFMAALSLLLIFHGQKIQQHATDLAQHATDYLKAPTCARTLHLNFKDLEKKLKTIAEEGGGEGDGGDGSGESFCHRHHHEGGGGGDKDQEPEQCNCMSPFHATARKSSGSSFTRNQLKNWVTQHDANKKRSEAIVEAELKAIQEAKEAEEAEAEAETSTETKATTNTDGAADADADADADAAHHHHHYKIPKLDLVFVGGSELEYMRGTELGKPAVPALSGIFDWYFTKKGGSDIEGLMLGMTEDRIPHIQWRLKNGEVVSDHHHLDPKVWWVQAGGLDIQVDFCSREVVLMGLIELIKTVRAVASRDAWVVINSLLLLPTPTPAPTTGNNDKNDNENDGKKEEEEESPQAHFNRHYNEDITWINERLECYVSYTKDARLTYFDAGQHVFLERSGGLATTSETMKKFTSQGIKLKTKTTLTTKADSVDPELMNGPFPSVWGYRKWSEAIVTYVEELEGVIDFSLDE